MISGAATIEGTLSLARRHPSLQYNRLGKTGWTVSPAGFGCYRVAAGFTPHFDAMVDALDSGINLIDTSTNYTDGASEQLVGQVLAHLISKDRMAREEVVVVSKVGYLQGQNYALSQERKQQGHPFPELVPYGKGLEHCIHPDFIEDQLDRSLERLGLETLDLLLLHNPEYYLGWAAGKGRDIAEAREIFYQRIHRAFAHLEKEVDQGRIQGYGISANTFPASAADSEFVSLEQVCEMDSLVSRKNHFYAIQFPMNLYESGALLEENQKGGRSLLETARKETLGVLINRPFNAFDGNRLVRLAEVEKIRRHTDEQVIQAITLLNKSETVLWRKLLPAMDLPMPLKNRVREQAAVGNQLKHHWRNFGHYERWRQFKDGLLWPHMQGVFDFLQPYAGQVDGLDQWLGTHRQKLESAVRAVGSLYVETVYREMDALRRKVKEADADWDADASLSQLALRALRSTTGVDTVLIGMRQVQYVDDVLNEIGRPVSMAGRAGSWRRLAAALKGV
ncbi:MAG: aldo/keto reductase [Desulfobacteraceae bacterium]